MTTTDKEARETIAKALCAGINQARKEIKDLRLEASRPCPLERRAAIKVELETWDDWVVELADALHWLNGAELEQMKNLIARQQLDAIPSRGG